ncbi:two component transcriptional regulator, LytTR family [Aquimarina amphilecti]|uniref:Two component transcriptional regulator, LytTR family n=1 Tax=Aquimarina amphilecti TaxID=1038014 RepID=A0A1H7VY18_AQUAM|nr:LytTR family DNA-binding domain-containing protein [Aquimarina amphilecti]SEM13687.1 two component transcriptional regulator, LytTR family [Aquimarina amphilecti]
MNNRIKCLIVDDEPLAREIIENYISRINHLELIDSCANALEAFNIITNKNIDLIFLDIQMPELNGIDFLKDLSPSTQVIFTTAYSDYAVDAFNLEAIDYLLKPIEFSRFLKSINKVLKLLDTTNSIPPVTTNTEEIDYQDVFIYLKVEKKMQKIFLKDIFFIESLKNYIKIKTSDREIIAYKGISSIESTLPSKKFLRVHRSFIVAIDNIQAFSTTEIEIKGIKIPVGRNYRESVKETLGYF